MYVCMYVHKIISDLDILLYCFGFINFVLQSFCHLHFVENHIKGCLIDNVTTYPIQCENMAMQNDLCFFPVNNRGLQ